MAPRNSKTSFCAPWIPNIASRRALDSPQQRSRRPHREAEGHAKPPRPSFRYRRLSVPDDFGTTSTNKKTAGDIAKASPRRLWGCRVQCFFFLLMICFCFFFCFSFFSSALSVSFTIIMRLRPRRGLRLELRLRLRMRLGLGL